MFGTVRLRHSRSNTSTEYSLPGATPQVLNTQYTSCIYYATLFVFHLSRASIAGRAHCHGLDEHIVFYMCSRFAQAAGTLEAAWVPGKPVSGGGG